MRPREWGRERENQVKNSNTIFFGKNAEANKRFSREIDSMSLYENVFFLMFFEKEREKTTLWYGSRLRKKKVKSFGNRFEKGLCDVINISYYVFVAWNGLQISYVEVFGRKNCHFSHWRVHRVYRLRRRRQHMIFHHQQPAHAHDSKNLMERNWDFYTKLRHTHTLNRNKISHPICHWAIFYFKMTEPNICTRLKRVRDAVAADA